jgi:steroid 5-alpha reductase family enzyme
MPAAVELFAMFGAAFVFSLGTMFIAWLIYLFQRKANVVDIGWSAAFLTCAWAYFFIGDGYAPKCWLITLMATAWAVRLGKHLAERYMAYGEDPRYAELRRKWGGDANNILFLMMFLLQGALVVILTMPFFIVCYAALPGWSGWELFGFLIWATGVAGESIADYQLSRFKADPANHAKVLQNGFWRYSRHPNYFFEWIVWVGFFLFAFSSPGGWAALISPVMMFGLLTKGSGIPLNEAEALRTKGDAYREYQQKTQPFFPWLPKRDALDEAGN